MVYTFRIYSGTSRLDRSGGRTSTLGYTGYLADQRFDIQVKPILVQTTFYLFLILFTILLIAEIGIMVKAIKKGPEAAAH